MKVKKGPLVTLRLVKVIPYKNFTDCTRFLLAKMYGIHEFIEHKDGIEIKTTMQVTGLFTFLWVKLVAEKIANDEPHQTHCLIERAKQLMNSTIKK